MNQVDVQWKVASPTRAVFAGGYGYRGCQHGIIEFVEIATTGNAVDFGDLTNFR